MAFTIREPPVLIPELKKKTSVPSICWIFRSQRIMGSGFQRTADSSCKGRLELAVMVLWKLYHTICSSPPPLKVFKEPEVLMKDQGKGPLVMKVVISFSTRTQFFDWFLRDGEGEGAGLWRGLLTVIITTGVWSGFLRTAHRRCKLCTLLQRDCAVEGEREEEAPFLSLPAAAAIFKMPSVSWAFAS